MINDREKSISNAFECDPELLPYMPELVADLWALGSLPDTYVELLQTLNHRYFRKGVLDLGCGKGAVSITLARELGFKAVGIDMCKPFLEEAERKAAEYGVSELCRFEYGDIREYVKQERDFDLVVYASLGSVLGGFAEIAEKLRNCIRPGGYMLIDGGFLKDSASNIGKRYRHYVSHDETVELLTPPGVALVCECIISDEKTWNLNLRYIWAISRRADMIAAEHPELAERFSRYIQSQQEECKIIKDRFTGSIWILCRI